MPQERFGQRGLFAKADPIEEAKHRLTRFLGLIVSVVLHPTVPGIHEDERTSDQTTPLKTPASVPAA